MKSLISLKSFMQSKKHKFSTNKINTLNKNMYNIAPF
jgi:hypothetical protein